MAKRAINYARVSTTKQAELYSLSYQLEQERAYDEEVGLVVVVEFAEDKSGRKMESRDQLEEACQLLERDEADVLVVWKFDRLHRNYVNSVILRDRIRKAGKEIHYAQSRTISGKTARQRLPEDLQYIMAEIEADDIAERTKTGKQRKVEEGKKWLGLNRPPFGYRKVGMRQDATLEIEPSEAAVVLIIFVGYVEGEYGVPLSVKEIVMRLSALQIPTPRDRDPATVHLKQRPYAEWGKSTIYGILKEPSYTGVFYHNRWKNKDGRSFINRNEDDWRGVPIPAIISKELFQAAQEKIARGTIQSSRNIVHEYLVSRRITCECGYRMRANTMERERTNKDGSVVHYTYKEYVCPGKKKPNEMVHPCDMPILKVSDVDTRVWEWVKSDIANPTILLRKLREIQATQQAEHSDVDATIASLRGKVAVIDEELKRLAMLFAHQQLPRHLAEQLMGEQNQKRTLLEKEINRLESLATIPLTDMVIDGLIEFSRAFKDRLATVEQSFAGRRTVIDGLDVQVVVFRKQGALWLRLTSLLQPKGQEIPFLTNSTIS